MEQVKPPTLHGDRKRAQSVDNNRVNSIPNKERDETPLPTDADDLRLPPDLGIRQLEKLD
jgi:hypothetical protein